MGCRIVVPGPLPADAGPEVQRNAGYTNLLSVLKDESSVAGLLSIKTVQPETADLIKMIARKAGAAAQALEKLFADPPPITIGNSGLPVVEIEARTWIANRTTVALLGNDGARLEYNLLLSQQKATDYIAALCAGLLKDEPSEARRTVLRSVKQEFIDLNTAVFNRLMAMEHRATEKGSNASD